MNVVISGPFGCGSLADELVLAGILQHLRQAKNSVTVLSADPDKTRAIHGVNAVKADDPGAFLSNKEAWKAMSSAHLFVLASAGPINGRGKKPARIWLAQLEHAQTAGLKTAVVGIGAEKIDDARERARVQRLLHHCAEGISARDESSKQALISYGMNANRISNNGDLTLALVTEKTQAAADGRIGIVLAASIPSRTEFGFEPKPVDPAIAEFARKLIESLLRLGIASIRLIVDDTDEANEFAETLENADDGKIESIAADCPIAKIQQAIAECRAVFSLSLHGLMLSAATGVLAAGIKAEPGASEFLASAGLADCVVDMNDPEAAAKKLIALSTDAAVRDQLKSRMATLRRKEAQNARMLELLVPRRVARERMDTGERVGKRKFGAKRTVRKNTDDVDFPD